MEFIIIATSSHIQVLLEKYLAFDSLTADELKTNMLKITNIVDIEVAGHLQESVAQGHTESFMLWSKYETVTTRRNVVQYYGTWMFLFNLYPHKCTKSDFNTMHYSY